jgi:hypothetical protein
MSRACSIALSFVLFACVPESDVHEISAGELSLSSPAPGAWIETSSIQVAGFAQGFDAVLINGTSVNVHDGQFELDVLAQRGVNVIEVTGVDQRGDRHFARHGVLAGAFDAPGAPIESAAHVRLNRPGLDTAESMVGTYLKPEELAAQATSMNPVYQDTYGAWGWDAVTIAADLDAVSFEVPDLNLIPRDGYMYIEAVIPTLAVDVSVYGDVAGMDFEEPVWVSADAAVLTSEAIIGVQNGSITADLGDSNISFQNFFIDTQMIPGAIEQALLGDTIQDKLETMILEQIQESVPALLTETLADLDISTEMELLGKKVELEATFGAAGVDAQGVFAAMDVQMSIPSQSERFYRGYLSADKGLTPKMDYQSAIYASLSDDVVNRGLFEAWRGGMLKYTVSTEDGSLPGAALSHFQADTGDVTIDAVLPPVLIERNQQLSLQVGELDVVVRTPGGGMGDYLKASITVFADVEMMALNGSVKLDLGQLDVHIMVRDSDWGASEEAITRVLEENLPIDALLSLIQDFEYPIPSFSGVEVRTVDLQRDGGAMHTNISVTLKD